MHSEYLRFHGLNLLMAKEDMSPLTIPFSSVSILRLDQMYKSLASKRNCLLFLITLTVDQYLELVLTYSYVMSVIRFATATPTFPTATLALLTALATCQVSWETTTSWLLNMKS